VTDLVGQTAGATVRVEVTAPATLAAQADSASVAHGGSVEIDVLANDSGHGQLVVDAYGQGAEGGSVTLESGRLHYVAPAGFHGTDRVSYTLADALGRTATAEVTVTVAAPVLAVRGDAAVTGHATAVDLAPTDNDTGLGTFDIVAVGQPGHGTVEQRTGGVLRYTPDLDFSGTDTFDYTARDDLDREGTAQITITVEPADPPVDDTAEVPYHTGTLIAVLANDPTGARVAAVGTPTSGQASAAIENGAVRYTPGSGLVGSDTVTYRLAGNSATATVTITIPEPPLVVQADTAGTAHATAVTVDPRTNDTGAGPVRVTGVGTPSHGTAEVTDDGRIRYTPAADHWGTDTVTYTAADLYGHTGGAQVTITVARAGAPVDDTTSVDYATSTVLPVLTNDPGGARIAEVGTPTSGKATAVLDGTTLRYTPGATLSGADTVTYRLVGNPDPATVHITVAAPQLSTVDDDATATAAGTDVDLTVLTNDLGIGLTLLSAGGAGNGTTSAGSDGVIRYRSAAGYRGTDQFSYTVRDIVGRTATGTVRVTVPNAAPSIAAAAGPTVVAGSTGSVPLTVADANDDPLTTTAGTPSGSPGAATQVNASVVDGALRFTVTRAFSGRVDVPVTVDDGDDEATVTVTVTVRPAPATGVRAGVAANPEARRMLATPVSRGGVPVSRTLSYRVDSVVTWRISPTTSVDSYRVHVDGARVCTVAAQRRTATQSCRVRGTVLRPGHRVRVTAIGPDGLAARPAAVPVTPPAASRHLLAVVYFPSGLFTLDTIDRAVLARMAAQARAYGFTTAAIVGHTDADGSRATNRALSRQRARQVTQYLERAHPEVGRTRTGYGEDRPVRPNDGPRHKATNRRVELYIG
jgi:outer membrane protein OmpA-like peptidoglycan-associated protein